MKGTVPEILRGSRQKITPPSATRFFRIHRPCKMQEARMPSRCRPSYSPPNHFQDSRRGLSQAFLRIEMGRFFIVIVLGCPRYANEQHHNFGILLPSTTASNECRRNVRC